MRARGRIRGYPRPRLWPLAGLALVCCGTPNGPSTGGGGPNQLRVNHVLLVLEENTNYADAVGGSMPYLDSLAGQYATATRYYANTHPSLGNYLMLTTGQVLTTNDLYTGPAFTQDNVVRRLVAAGKTWKAYAEDLPAAGDVRMGLDTGSYLSRHNPVVYLSDVQSSPTQAANVVPFTEFATDLAQNALPNYAFIVPNACDDAHNCSLATADQWLRTNIDPLVRDPQFQQDGLLLILFDEAKSDSTNGGGKVAWVAVSGKSKPGYRSMEFYQHESTLRLSLEALGITTLPGAAASAPAMNEFFTP